MLVGDAALEDPMDRTWFSRGLRGMTAKRIQLDLLRQGIFDGPPDKFVDGDYGGHTEAALRTLQARRQLTVTGAVDTATWQQLTTDPLPTLFERCLGLTADFEGHGFGRLEGNFDGAGLTWGIIGFTLSNGEIQQLLSEAEQVVPGTLARVLGPLAAVWSDVMNRPRAQQLAWADSISSGPGKGNVPPEWRQAFAALGDEPVVKRLQMQRAYDAYFVPATATAKQMKLESELGIALAFDMHVQNGTSRKKAVAELASLAGTLPEPEMRRRLAQRVAALSSAAFSADVLSRKTTIAEGQGTVHGRSYRLAAWGLGEVAAA